MMPFVLILSFTRFHLHLAAIPVHPLYGDPAPQVLLEPAVEGDALSDIVDHREELEEGSERWPTIFRHAHLRQNVRIGFNRAVFSVHLSSVDKLEKPSAVLEGDIWQQEHLVPPIFLLQQTLQ